MISSSSTYIKTIKKRPTVGILVQPVSAAVVEPVSATVLVPSADVLVPSADVLVPTAAVLVPSADVLVPSADVLVPTISDETHILLNTNFTKCVKGYHLVNDDPIKEALWEDINTVILNASGCHVHSKSSGSHQSGGDISCSLGYFSNKSTQYEKRNQAFKISSYRLTTVCSDKEPGIIETIIEEINSRKNFNYYSIIIREDTVNEILYDWYLIPSDFPAFNPATYKWTPKLGKIGKNKGATIGWETNMVNGSSMSITFSMSSQLWIDISITEEMKQFVIGSCKVQRGKKYNYIQLYENSL